MNIDELSDQEKSVLLARAMGLEIIPHPTRENEEMFVIPESWGWEWEWHDDFYPKWMALAWRVHLWALLNGDIGTAYGYWWRPFPRRLAIWYSTDAQDQWLDKVLTLAIEAGLVELDHAS